MARTKGNRHAEATALVNIGECLFSTGDKQTGIEHLKKSHDIFRELQQEHERGKVLMSLANMYLEQEQSDKAIQCWQNARMSLHPTSPEYNLINSVLAEIGI